MTDQPAQPHVRSTIEVFDHHLFAFAKGVDALVSDYTEDSWMLLPNSTLRGLTDIRQFFTDFLQGIQPGFWEAFRITRQVVEGDIAYLVWEAPPFVTMATDTLLVRDGKILVQTFTPLAHRQHATA